MTRTSPGTALQYFMVTWAIGEEFGGMTTMCLYRAEIFRRLAGIRAPVLTFNPIGTYDEIRARLQRTGLLHTDTPVLNLYEYYRGQDFSEMEPLATPQKPAATMPEDVLVEDTLDSSGGLFSTIFTDSEGDQTYCRKYF